nr:branched-chain amino acid ABC transporter permease [Desulfitobacterium metallireducens]
MRNVIVLIGVILIYGIVQGLNLMDIIPPFLQLNLILACIYIIMAASLNLINGITGQFSIGHAGFMSIGAFVSAIVIVNLNGPLYLGLIAGALAAGIAGVLIGLPTLRLNGDYLAIATLGLGEIVRVIFMNMDYVGGASGFSVPSTINWTWAFWLMVISVLAIHNFTASTHGRACISIRENEIAAEAMGINTTKYKVLAFTLGAMFAGLAGGIYANYMYLIHPIQFNFLKSFDFLVMVVLGGLGSLTGSILGAIVMTFLSALLSGLSEWRMVITAILMILLMLFRPSGLMGTKEFSLNFLGKKGERNDSSQSK